jgi:hypothetical protein
VCASVGGDALLRFWDLGGTGEARFVRLYALGVGPDGDDPEPTAVSFAPDGECVAVGFRHGAVWVLPGPGPITPKAKRCVASEPGRSAGEGCVAAGV